MSKILGLNRITSITHSEWVRSVGSVISGRRIFVVASGYEERSIHWTRATIDKLPPSAEVSYLVVGFQDFPNALSRPSNDRFYTEKGLRPKPVNSERQTDFVGLVEDAVRSAVVSAGAQPVEVHVDYSCIPRLWYCRLPVILDAVLRPCDTAFFWYTPGAYPETDYPTAGIDDFELFSGKPSLGAKIRTHILGLGFDRTRSQAIWSVLDPQNLVCFYADPAVRPQYVERVKEDNEYVLAAAKSEFTVPIGDFVDAYSRIASVAFECRHYGDVILVPDGPKPFVLAASLVPFRSVENGITCFHVKRRKSADFKPVDVSPAGDPFGFHFRGQGNGANVRTRMCPSSSS